MAWYRQYRPKTVAELNIEEVRQSLQAMMAAGKIPQSLLFAGPKGTGKTSASRIIALMLNDPANADLVDQLYFGQKTGKKKLKFVEPQPDSPLAKQVYEGQSFAVHELDAASNRGIDDIRQLKERIALPPQGAKMAVYILDEVHMLTTEAFNALLKVLEEPPAHAVFILATTELHKLPETIVSRCTLINFRKALDQEIMEALERIVQAEAVNYKAEQLATIARRAGGSFRDAVKILELACQNGQLDLSVINSLIVDYLADIQALLSAVLAKDEQTVSQIFLDLRARNVKDRDFYKDLLAFLHRDLLINLAVVEGEAFTKRAVDQFLLDQLLKADLNQDSSIPFLPLELALLKMVDQAQNQAKNGGANGMSHSRSAQPRVKKNSKKAQTKQELETVNQAVQIQTAEPATDQTATTLWQELLNFVAEENFSLSALLKSCQLEAVVDGTARVLVFYHFHKEQLEQVKYQDLLADYCHRLFSQDLKFNFVLAQNPATAGKLLEQAKDVLL